MDTISLTKGYITVLDTDKIKSRPLEMKFVLRGLMECGWTIEVYRNNYDKFYYQIITTEGEFIHYTDFPGKALKLGLIDEVLE